MAVWWRGGRPSPPKIAMISSTCFHFLFAPNILHLLPFCRCCSVFLSSGRLVVLVSCDFVIFSSSLLFSRFLNDVELPVNSPAVIISLSGEYSICCLCCLCSIWSLDIVWLDLSGQCLFNSTVQWSNNTNNPQLRHGIFTIQSVTSCLCIFT